MIRKIFLMFSILLSAWAVKAQQSQNASEEFKFVQYLIDNNDYRSAITVLHLLDKPVYRLSSDQSDSLNYYKGWVYYQSKSLDSSTYFLSKVKLGSAYYHKSGFYSAFNNSYQGNNTQARQVLNELQLENDTNLMQLKYFQQAAISLLDKDFDQYNQIKQKFNYNYFAVSEEQGELDKYARDLKAVGKKSPVLAGLMSAVVPGTGKMYAGYKAQGLATLLQVGLFGGAAAESYIRSGPKSAQFIIIGGIFSAFYLGNIWGSALSVKIKRQEQFNEIHHSLLLDMHIPLRRVFN